MKDTCPRHSWVAPQRQLITSISKSAAFQHCLLLLYFLSLQFAIAISTSSSAIIDFLFNFTFNGRRSSKLLLFFLPICLPPHRAPRGKERKAPQCVGSVHDGVFIVAGSYYYNAAEKRCLMKMMMALIRGLVQHCHRSPRVVIIIGIVDEDEWGRCCNWCRR